MNSAVGKARVSHSRMNSIEGSSYISERSDNSEKISAIKRIAVKMNNISALINIYNIWSNQVLISINWPLVFTLKNNTVGKVPVP